MRDVHRDAVTASLRATLEYLLDGASADVLFDLQECLSRHASTLARGQAHMGSYALGPMPQVINEQLREMARQQQQRQALANHMAQRQAYQPES
jgi:hypothetical protein